MLRMLAEGTPKVKETEEPARHWLALSRAGDREDTRAVTVFGGRDLPAEDAACMSAHAGRPAQTRAPVER